MTEPQESEFRIHGDPDLRITNEEVEAQRAALEKLRSRLTRGGKLHDLDPDIGKALLVSQTDQQRADQKNAEDIRAGLNPDIRLPDEEELREIAEQDPSTARLYALGEVRPGTEAYVKRIPPPEQTIEVIGPKGPEGFGIVKRYDVTGTREL